MTEEFFHPQYADPDDDEPYDEVAFEKFVANIPAFLEENKRRRAATASLLHDEMWFLMTCRGDTVMPFGRKHDGGISMIACETREVAAWVCDAICKNGPPLPWVTEIKIVKVDADGMLRLLGVRDPSTRTVSLVTEGHMTMVVPFEEVQDLLRARKH